MKRLIRWQMTAVLLGLVVFMVVFLLCMNGSLLESYYIHNKKDDFKKVYHALVVINQEDKLNDAESKNELRRLTENSNIGLVILGQNTIAQYRNVYDTDILVSQLLGYALNQEQAWPRKILESADDYEISSSTEQKSKAEYLEMWGQFDNGNLFLMRSPIESIRDSVSISNQFIMYMGGVSILLSCLIAWYFAKRFTGPILELTAVSQKMTELDFEARYTSGGENEIGILGTNFNLMSEKLEQTITELKNANYELHRDIEQKELEETRRTEFLGNVSHELKTPIALIQGYAEGLKESVNEDSSSREFYCDVIIDEAQKMNQMVRNLMALNQLEIGHDSTDFTRFNITDLISGVIESYGIMIRQREVKVNFHQREAVYAWGDQFKIEQVIRNYISNALNHAANEKVIEIKIFQENDKVRITVFNTGAAIPEEDKERIWEKFYKVDKAHSREYGGNGIGLSIVKAIMESFRQEYGVRNYENGVEFWFQLDIK